MGLLNETLKYNLLANRIGYSIQICREDETYNTLSFCKRWISWWAVISEKQ